MIEAQDVIALKLPKELEPFLGGYYKALAKRADMELLGKQLMATLRSLRLPERR
jgi:hypothetical protein